MKFSRLCILITSSLVLAACSHTTQNTALTTPGNVQNIQTSPSVSPQAQTESWPNNQSSYTFSEVARHNTREDCWLVLAGKVYDVTKMIPNHPGGEAILQGCGKDATELFETRPMGSKTSHSQRARDLAKNFEIGVLAQ